MNRRNAIAITTLISLFAVAGFADNKPPSEKEISTLIQQLVSPNPAPDDKNGRDAQYPPDYDHSAQQGVRSAWRQLNQLGIRVFPYLFDHFDDKRYSFTDDEGSRNTNWAVGLACSDILICHLQPFGTLVDDKDACRRPRPSYSEYYNLRTSAGAKLWWETRKDKALRELQIEVLEWIIAEEVKTPANYPDRERASLKDVLTKLRAAKKPLLPSVPWVR
jgi:hypothetical protein